MKLSNFIAISLLIFLCVVSYFDSEKSHIIKVNRKEVKEHRYMIYTDWGVFENTDALLYKKFNSSDIYNRIEEGKKYRIKAVGWRNEICSWYPNIVELKDYTPRTKQLR